MGSRGCVGAFSDLSASPVANLTWQLQLAARDLTTTLLTEAK